MLVAFSNPSIVNNAKTDLTAKLSATGTTLTVRDTTGFTAGLFIVIGQYGNENAEIRRISSVTDQDTLVISAGASFDHPAGDTVTIIYFDKIDIRYKIGTGGTETVIAGMPVDLLPDRQETVYQHSTGLSTYYYQSRYYNSYTAQYSDWSVWFPAAGFSRATVNKMVESVQKVHPQADREEIISLFNDCQDEVAAIRTNWFFLKTEDTTTYKTTASTQKYALPTDFQRLVTLRYHKDDGVTDSVYRLKYWTETKFDYEAANQDDTDDDDLTNFTLTAGDSTNPQGYYKVYPTPATSDKYFEIVYYKKMTDLADPDDTTLIPIPKLLENYAKRELYANNERKYEEANYYDKLYQRDLASLQMLQKRNVGQPRGFTYDGDRRSGMQRWGSDPAGDDDPNEFDF